VVDRLGAVVRVVVLGNGDVVMATGLVVIVLAELLLGNGAVVMTTGLVDVVLIELLLGNGDIVTATELLLLGNGVVVMTTELIDVVRRELLLGNDDVVMDSRSIQVKAINSSFHLPYRIDSQAQKLLKMYFNTYTCSTITNVVNGNGRLIMVLMLEWTVGVIWRKSVLIYAITVLSSVDSVDSVNSSPIMLSVNASPATKTDPVLMTR